MVVLICKNVKPSMRGELSRWMIEADAGVFIARLSSRVRDLLWAKVVEECGDGTALMVHTANTEQGFAVRAHGTSSRTPTDWEGVVLIRFQTRKNPD